MEDAKRRQKIRLCHDGYRFCRGEVFEARIMTYLVGGGRLVVDGSAR